MVYTYYLVTLYLITPNTTGTVTSNMDSSTTKEAITKYPDTISNPTIKYGDCPPKTPATSPGNARIDNPDKPNATLTITDMQPATTAALADTPQTQCTVKVDTETNTLTIKYKQGNANKCIEITLTGDSIKKEATTVHYGHIFTGMIVPFYLIDKIEMLLLIATAIPAITIAILRATAEGDNNPQSPACEWSAEENANFGQGPGFHWHIFDIMIPIMITLADIFIYSLHYGES